jgi:hypothetical protein
MQRCSGTRLPFSRPRSSLYVDLAPVRNSIRPGSVVVFSLAPSCAQGQPKFPTAAHCGPAHCDGPCMRLRRVAFYCVSALVLYSVSALRTTLKIPIRRRLTVSAVSRPRRPLTPSVGVSLSLARPYRGVATFTCSTEPSTSNIVGHLTLVAPHSIDLSPRR